MNGLNKVAEYKIGIQKPTVFFYNYNLKISK